jgi:hypothetical protein
MFLIIATVTERTVDKLPSVENRWLLGAPAFVGEGDRMFWRILGLTNQNF